LFISDAPGSYFVAITDDTYPQVLVKFGGKHEKRAEETIDVEQFIGKKGYKAKGKKATTFEVASIQFIEPLQKEENMPDSQDNGPDSNADGGQESYSIGDSVDMTLF
jgi:topoisomerase-4 subunit A